MRARARARGLCGLIALAVSAPLCAAAAPGGDAPDPVLVEAKAHFQKGREAYDAQDYSSAIREFLAADRLKPSAMLAYNIGLALEQAGQKPAAVAAYRRYLAAKPDAPNRAEVEERMAALEPGSAASPRPPPPTVTPAAPTAPAAPAAPIAPTPAPAPAVAAPPPTTVPMATLPGYHPPPPTVASPVPYRACPPGRIVTAVTAGNCCWPGQAWAHERAACAGPPQCPYGYYASGETCLPPMQPLPLSLDPWGQPSLMMPPPAMGPPGTVPVGFAARRSAYVYRVNVGKSGERGSCETPCTLFLKPGPAKLEIAGPAAFSARIKVLQGSGSFVVEHRRWPSFIGGTVLMGLGTAALVAGTVLVARGATTSDQSSGNLATSFGLAALCGSVAGVILPIGISMMATLDEDRVAPRSGYPSAAAPGPRFAGAGLAATGSGAAGLVRFEF